MKHKDILLLMLAIIIIIQGGIVGYLFQNPHPCVTSGIGCSSIFETLMDTWSSYYALISGLIGMLIIYFACSVALRGEKQ